MRTGCPDTIIGPTASPCFGSLMFFRAGTSCISRPASSPVLGLGDLSQSALCFLAQPEGWATVSAAPCPRAWESSTQARCAEAPTALAELRGLPLPASGGPSLQRVQLPGLGLGEHEAAPCWGTGMGSGSSRQELGCRMPGGVCAGSITLLHVAGCTNKGRFSKELQPLLCDRTVAAARRSVPEPASVQEAAAWSVPLLPPELVPGAQLTEVLPCAQLGAAGCGQSSACLCRGPPAVGQQLWHVQSAGCPEGLAAHAPAGPGQGL